MKIFASVVRKTTHRNGHELSTIELHQIISKQIRTVFPVLDFDTSCDIQQWTSAHENTIAQISSNESKVRFATSNKSQATFTLGYSDKNISEVFNGVFFRPEVLPRCAGQFSFIALEDKGVDLVTDATGSHPFYIGEDINFRVVCSRSNLTHAILDELRKIHSGLEIQFDLLGCRDLALQGHYLGRRTAYEKIESTKVHEYTRISAYGIERESWLNSRGPLNPLDSSEYRSLVNNLSCSLVDSLWMLKNEKLHLSLTGGRDSRLLAAMLSNIPSIQVETATSGVEQNPDVILGAAIAKTLGWKHRIVTPNIRENKLLVEDPIDRVRRTLDVHDNSTSAWDECPDYGAFSAKPTMSGVGGEILRGGMTLATRPAVSSQDAQQILRNTMSGGGFFNKEIQEASEEGARLLLMHCEHDPNGALDRYYHEQRNHRWVCNRRNGARMRWNVVDPLLDNKVVCLALAVGAKERWSERLVFDVIGTLAPSLRDIPIEGERWRFERNGPSKNATANEQEAWGKRYPLKASEIVQRMDWRRLNDSNFKNVLIKGIQENLNKTSLQLFDERALMAYLEKTQYPTTVWHIFTTILLMNGIARQGRSQKTELLEVSCE